MDATVNNIMAAFDVLYNLWAERETNPKWNQLVENTVFSDNSWARSAAMAESLFKYIMFPYEHKFYRVLHGIEGEEISTRLRFGHKSPSDEAIHEALKWLGDFNELEKVKDKDMVLDEIFDILMLIGYPEAAHYLRDIKTKGRIRGVPVKGVFEDLAGLTVDKGKDGYWILIPEDIASTAHHEHIVTFVHEIVESYLREIRKLEISTAHNQSSEAERQAYRMNIDALRRRKSLSKDKSVPTWAKGLRIYYTFMRNALMPKRNADTFGNTRDLKFIIKQAKKGPFRIRFSV